MFGSLWRVCLREWGEGWRLIGDGEVSGHEDGKSKYLRYCITAVDNRTNLSRHGIVAVHVTRSGSL